MPERHMAEDLAAFLRARYDEEEASAVARHAYICLIRDAPPGVDLWADKEKLADPARCTCGQKPVLLRLDMQRRLLDAHDIGRQEEPDFVPDCPECWQFPPCTTVRLLGVPYAGYADYQQVWAPMDHGRVMMAAVKIALWPDVATADGLAEARRITARHFSASTDQVARSTLVVLDAILPDATLDDEDRAKLDKARTVATRVALAAKPAT